MKLIITTLLLLSSMAHSADKVGSIKGFVLKDGTEISTLKDIEVIQVNTDRENNIDWVELREGTLIDSTDIQQIIIDKTEINTTINQIREQNSFLRVKLSAGDGSGG